MAARVARCDFVRNSDGIQQNDSLSVLGCPAAALFDHSVYSAIIVASDSSSTNLAAAKASFVSFFNAVGGIVGLGGVPPVALSENLTLQ